MDAQGFIARRCSKRAQFHTLMDAGSSNRYVVAIHRTPNGFFARVQGLPGCIARGATEVEALENVREMIRLHAAIARLAAGEKPRVSLEISA